MGILNMIVGTIGFILLWRLIQEGRTTSFETKDWIVIIALMLGAGFIPYLGIVLIWIAVNFGRTQKDKIPFYDAKYNKFYLKVVLSYLLTVINFFGTSCSSICGL